MDEVRGGALIYRAGHDRNATAITTRRSCMRAHLQSIDELAPLLAAQRRAFDRHGPVSAEERRARLQRVIDLLVDHHQDRKSTRLNSSHVKISYAVFCLKKKKNKTKDREQTPPRN